VVDGTVFCGGFRSSVVLAIDSACIEAGCGLLLKKVGADGMDSWKSLVKQVGGSRSSDQTKASGKFTLSVWQVQE